ncbi:hypothetical protein [Paraherbaspirillum soli]|uniref:Uncharacterized protein n=1 Tax=Paraherbaspirillum soli TaxID=631222 RepID=A0ABW0MD05_9BURK
MKTQENITITIGTGTSYGEYDEQGKLVSMNGFFERWISHLPRCLVILTAAHVNSSGNEATSTAISKFSLCS